MEVTVKVMHRGREIDQITRPLRSSGGQPAVTYKKLLCPVIDGCIHIEPEFTLVVPPHTIEMSEWATLVARLLPTQLPTQRTECSELLQNCFRKILPDGVVRAVSSLTFTGLEQEARELLVDFLREKHDSEKLLKELRAQPHFNENPEASNRNVASPPGNIEPRFGVEAIIDDEHSDWDWMPAQETSAPRVNDLDLRKEAERVQKTIGIFRSSEQGAVIPDLNVREGEFAWMHESSPTTQYSNAARMESALVERTAKLGSIALDLLRYFADNPGDRASHAELVLGYATTDINKFLSGSLSSYLKRSGSGGWECQPWTHDVLAALDEAR